MSGRATPRSRTVGFAPAQSASRAAVAAAVLLAGLALVFSGRATATGWTATPVARPAVPTGELLAASCPSTGFCAALGRGPEWASSDGVERTGWRLVPPPGGSGGGGVSFGDVSCSTSRFCVAVPGSGTAGGLEVWDGHAWGHSRISLPVAERAEVVSAVVCRSRRSCVLVGSMRNARGRIVELAERWNGSRWRVDRVPTVAGAQASGLRAVSCPSVRWCMAVGVAARGSRKTPADNATVGFADLWNGATWVRQAVGHQPPSSALNDVSCSSSHACMAAGSGGPGESAAERGPLVERWNGRQWTLAGFAAVVPTGGFGNSQFTHVSCPSRSLCVAVGTYFWTNGGDTTGSGDMVARWNGKSWSADVTGGDGIAYTNMNAVSCSGTTGCTVVGADHGLCQALSCENSLATFATRWNGRGWSRQPTPGAGTLSTVALSSAVCASQTNCLVAGTQTMANGAPGSLSEVWNGTAWTDEPAPGDGLSSLACVSTVECFSFTDLPTVAGRLLTWRGSALGAVQSQPPSDDPGDNDELQRRRPVRRRRFLARAGPRHRRDLGRRANLVSDLLGVGGFVDPRAGR